MIADGIYLWLLGELWTDMVAPPIKSSTGLDFYTTPIKKAKSLKFSKHDTFINSDLYEVEELIKVCNLGNHVLITELLLKHDSESEDKSNTWRSMWGLTILWTIANVANWLKEMSSSFNYLGKIYAFFLDRYKSLWLTSNSFKNGKFNSVIELRSRKCVLDMFRNCNWVNLMSD